VLQKTQSFLEHLENLQLLLVLVHLELLGHQLVQVPLLHLENLVLL
jgi:hypothetical protein